MGETVSWQRISPLVILLIAGALGGLQILLFPIGNTSITIQAVTEVVFLVVVIIGLFLIPSSRELTELSAVEAQAVYPPILLGLGLFTIRGLTDVLDEFLVHPSPALAILEDGTMVIGVVLLLLGIIRWTRIQERQERNLAEQQRRLSNQNERLDSFVSVVSHDLRNPLTVAQGRLELAREDDDNEDLQSIARALHRMEDLIEDLLVLAREGDAVGDLDSIDLANLADQCWQTVDTHEADIVIETNQVITADESRLQQLFENLFRNAVEHGGEVVTITVGDLQNGFYVEDDGDGIPPEKRSDVFNDGYSSGQEGTGFGLSIVKEIADAHGWEVRLIEGTNGGARFEVTGVEST